MSDAVSEGSERFPGFNTLEQAETWDSTTRTVILARVDDVPEVEFFSENEARAAEALLDCLLAQELDRVVPVMQMIDARLAARDGDGYRYENMPEDGDAWRRSLAGLDNCAIAQFGSRFVDLEHAHRHTLIQSIQDHDGSWMGMPADRLFGLWMRYACTAFYSHPQAWNEIGFGGPAYPRGYKNVGLGRREPWEVAEVDAGDPVPWSHRVEAAHRRHDEPAAQYSERH